MKLIRISAVWCPSCIITQKIWNEIKEEYKEITYEEYDYDLDIEIVKKYNIGKIIPVIIMLDHNDVEISRIIGEKKKKDIVEMIRGV